jgi:hypothetical protein
MKLSIGLAISKLKKLASILASLSDSNVAANTVNRRADTNVTTGVTALGADFPGAITYSLADSASGKFKIDATTGIVTTNADFRPTALVYQTPVTVSANYSSNTVQAGPSKTVTVGRLCIVAIAWTNVAAPPSIADSRGNTWVACGSGTVTSNTVNVACYASIITTGGSMVPTVTFGTACNNITFGVFELTNPHSATPTFTSNTTTANGASTSCALTGVYSYLRDHMIFIGSSSSDPNNNTWVPPSPFVERNDGFNLNICEISSPYKNNNNVFTWTVTNSAKQAGLLVTFPATPILTESSYNITARGTSGATIADEVFAIAIAD